MAHLGKSLLILLSLLLIWQAVIELCHLPDYILPQPLAVLVSLIQNHTLLFQSLLPTAIETISSLIAGTLCGVIAAVLLIYVSPLRAWFLPILILSQAIPTFVIAPLFVLWFGYGMLSKIAIGTLMVFFPITSTFYDGLRRTPIAFLHLAKTMQATRTRLFWHIQLPNALPSLASGLRIAAVLAPAAALVGEWVGASRGLGYLMLNANARMQIDLMFAALLFMIGLTLTLYFIINAILKKWIWWP